MADLWDILPDRVLKIHTSEEHIYYSDGDETQYFDVSDLIAINWHDKTEITRPIQEATEADIGKLCVFWDMDNEVEYFGILSRVYKDCKYHYLSRRDDDFVHCRRLTKKEISELC
jgi:hypothetical protein